jgi:hypothetical protein
MAHGRTRPCLPSLLRSSNYINTEKESGVRNEGGQLPAINKSCFKQVVSHPQLHLISTPKTKNPTLPLGLAVARLGRFPMGRDHPQGADTQLVTSN